MWNVRVGSARNAAASAKSDGTPHRRTGVRVLPGAYLSRDAADGSNPGRAYVRVALVAEAAEVAAGLRAIRTVMETDNIQERMV